MKRSVLAIFCLFLIMGFFNLYIFIQTQSNSVPELKVQNAKLEWELKNQELKTMLANYELEDYRQYLALVLPNEIRNNSPANYQLRNLASVVKEPLSDNLAIERASSLLSKAKKAFEGKDYVGSNKLLHNLIEDYPDSIHSVEAHFLLIEGQYQSQDFENCIASIDDMLTLYPENELTGYAMLRLGKIFESQDRVEDAVEVYKALIRDFKSEKLQSQARLSLKGVEL